MAERVLDEIDVETPEVDAAEQAVVAGPSWHDDEPEEPGRSRTPAPVEANEWDVQEQARVVEFDDDYR
ncbi:MULTISPECIES: hypothetical protein [Actinoplanes]|uniref:hypothetical protein n=1 Tax=Actinoplanes TaxID=1865 RepID=UPI0005F2E836|nr:MULTISPECIES: hypothetical protein [Actinoplanes]